MKSRKQLIFKPLPDYEIVLSEDSQPLANVGPASNIVYQNYTKKRDEEESHAQLHKLRQIAEILEQLVLLQAKLSKPLPRIVFKAIE